MAARRGHRLAPKSPPLGPSWATVDEIVFPIAKQKDWLDLLEAGKLDIALNLGTHDAHGASALPDVEISWRQGLLVHWFVWRRAGPLADRRVRRALNYAVHKKLLIEIAGHGRAVPQVGNAWIGRTGHDPDLQPYPYDPDMARRLLSEAGYPDGFSLSGLVCDVTNSSFQLLRGFFASVGVELDGTIVPRGEFMRIVTEAKMGPGDGLAGDFHYSMYDNPLGHGLFHHFVALFSKSPLSLWSSDEYDERFGAALSAVPGELDQAMRNLDRYAIREALALFTLREPVYVATRAGFRIPIHATGHFNYDSLWRIEAPARRRATTERPVRAAEPDPDVEHLLEATSYPGTLLLPRRETLESHGLAQLWRNIELSDARWKLLAERMTNALVDQVAARTRLDNISRSTEGVGILVMSADDRVLFENSGYVRVTGCSSDETLDSVLRDDNGQACWERIKVSTSKDGSWAGVLNMKGRRIHLTVTPALNELDDRTGYVGIFFDYSHEEDRLRLEAEAETAGLVQKALFPVMRRSDHLAAYYAPAAETGGDWYYVDDGDKFLTLMIGDVTGHGTPAALLTASVAGAINVLDLDGQPPRRILGELNNVVRNTGFGQYYMSFYYLKIDKHTRRYRFSSAAHHSPILITRGGVATIPVHRALGHLLGDRPADTDWPEAEGILEPGTLLFLYTDGISEGRNPDDVEYGFSRLRRFFRRIDRTRSCQAILDDLRADARVYYSGIPLEDDLTLILARVQ